MEDLRRGFRVGRWVVSPLSGDVQSGDDIVHLEPKVMEVLVALAEQAESVVLRDELLQKVWGARAAISDEPLTRCIAQLRQSLGDSSRNPEYIQTVPKRGYRLLQAVQVLADGAVDSERGAAGPETRPGLSGVAVPGPDGPSRATPGRWTTAGWIGGLAIVSFLAYVLGTKGLPLGEPGPWSQQCDIEPSGRIVSDQARQYCEEGLERMAERNAESLRTSMSFFRAAIAEQEDYGSAIVNLARAMVLLPTYDENAKAEDCDINAPFSEYEDCFEVAFSLLEDSYGKAEYIADYWHGIRAYVLTKQHRWDPARILFEQALTRTPDDTDMLQWYSQFLSATGMYTESLQVVERAIDINPDSPVLYDRLGVIRMWLGDTDGAKAAYERAEQFPGHSPYVDSLLVLNIRLGNYDAVRRLLRNYGIRDGQEDTWVDPFVAALEDPSLRPEAVRAVQAAIDSGELYGQYRYGALVYLEDAEQAIRSAILLIRSNPTGLDVEFLYAEETQILRDNSQFGELLRELGLDDYWREDGVCPWVLSQGEIDWCEWIRD